MMFCERMNQMEFRYDTQLLIEGVHPDGDPLSQETFFGQPQGSREKSPLPFVLRGILFALRLACAIRNYGE